MAAAIAHGSSPGPASSWPSNTAAPGPTHRKPMARRSDLSRPPCANGPTRNTGLTPIKETCTYNHGTITTTGKDPMVASITARPSAAPRSEQPLDHLQPPALIQAPRTTSLTIVVNYRGLKSIDKKLPARSSAPAVTNKVFVAPLFVLPPPKAIPQTPLMMIFLPHSSLIVPTNLPVIGSNPLISPWVTLFVTSRVLLNGPKLLGAAAMPQAWFSGGPWINVFTKVPSSLKRSIKPPALLFVIAYAT